MSPGETQAALGEGIESKHTRPSRELAHTYSELPQGDDKFSHIHNFRKTKQKLKPKPAPEYPRPGAADCPDCSGEVIKSALAGLGS